ncbi:MAG: hypothetical protein FWD19_02615 [Defluviitaleaceae bacterium]|nr:hypothetical protein [Defluviitaleaceae bacterium]
MIMGLIQLLINGFGAMGRFIAMLPQSPFQNLSGVIGENPYIDAVLWIIPVGQALSLLQAWLTAITLYYAVKVPLRWAKVIQS